MSKGKFISHIASLACYHLNRQFEYIVLDNIRLYSKVQEYSFALNIPFDELLGMSISMAATSVMSVEQALEKIVNDH